VADGALEYLPFAALPDPLSRRGEPLGRRELVQLPSASALAVLRGETESRPGGQRLVAVLADPVFSAEDSRVGLPAGTRRRLPAVASAAERAAADAGFGGGRLPRLPATRREAAAIIAAAPPHQARAALDFEASRRLALDGELQGYRIVHFATHSLLDNVHPELSGVVLSLVDASGRAQEGYLRLDDVFNLRLPVDLVVLSACRTALGRELRGEGLMGLTRGFLYAGAKGVVASLWTVDDRATAELMGRFYRALLGPEHLRPAAALRVAQDGLRGHRRWSHPYYWAGFVLQGEWR